MDFIATALQEGKDIDILEAAVKLAPVFQKLIPYDFMVGIADREKFIANFPAKDVSYRLPFLTGSSLPKEDAIYLAMETGKVQTVNVPPEAFGVPFQASGIPIRDRDGNIIGGIGVGVSSKGINILRESAASVSAAGQQLAATTEELAATAARLSQDLAEIKNSGIEVLAQVKKTDDILRFINEVVANSNLLGLNAAIEAARAGEHGRGFSVVAEEIRKMAVNSAESVKEVKQIVQEIADRTRLMLEKIETTGLLGDRQVTATEEISVSVQELAVVAENVEKALHEL
jgi:uncharacterized protein YukE